MWPPPTLQQAPPPTPAPGMVLMAAGIWPQASTQARLSPSCALGPGTPSFSSFGAHSLEDKDLVLQTQG